MSKKAAIYVRVSRAYTDRDERVTIDSQLADCQAYCEEHGYIVVAQFIDKDKYRVKRALKNPSGERKDRPGYLAMLRAAKNEEFDILVAWKEDRLYRGMYAAMPLSEVLDVRKKDFRVELVKENFDPQMLGIKAAIAKLELDNIRDRMIMGRRARLERGEAPGGPIRYGYYKGEDNRVAIEDSEAQIVRQIFEWYVSGENGMEIRRRLNAMGVPPRVNKIWSKASIANILSFEGYANGSYSTTLDGEVFSIPCPQIISMDVWKKALSTREANKGYRGRNVKEDYLCRGMVICPCGWTWTARTCYGPRQNGKSGYYGCARKDHQPEQVHPDCPGTIGSKKLDDFVWDFVVNICQNPEIVQKAIDAKIETLRAEQGDIELEIEKLQREINRLDNERQWVITTARKGKISEDDMEKQLSVIDLQINELNKKLDEKLSAILLQEQTSYLKEWADQYLQNLSVGLQVLETDVTTLDEMEMLDLYSALDANRFDEKFKGIKRAALRWAILEEKRKTVRMIISNVLVIKEEDGGKKIIPQLAFDVPDAFKSLVYDYQSLAYVERARDMVEGD